MSIVNTFLDSGKTVEETVQVRGTNSWSRSVFRYPECYVVVTGELFYVVCTVSEKPFRFT